MKLNSGLCRLIVSAAALALVACATYRAEDAESVLRRADQAMGGTNLKTIRYAGSGTGGTFGQAYRPGMAWPKLNYSTYSRLADYENSALREELARSRAEPMGGGGLPLMGMGEQRTTGLLRGTSAWNMVGPAPVPAPIAVNARIHDLWTTPHGVIKAALRNKATLAMRNEGGKSVVSFTEPGRFTATAWINADNLVERIDSRLPHLVLGDTSVETTGKAADRSRRLHSGPAQSGAARETERQPREPRPEYRAPELSVDRILPLHGRIVPLADLHAAIGRKP